MEHILSKLGIELLSGMEAVIFDLDGTLVDSMWVWGAIDEADFKRHGHEVPETLQRDISGMSFTETAVYIKKTYPYFTEPVEELKAIWSQMAFKAYQEDVPLKPGAYEFLRYLHEKGIKTGVASSNHIDLVEAALTARGVRDYMNSVHTSCEVPHGKPEPDIYLLVAEDLQIPPSRCLIFEDIPEGILAGIHAGMRTCAVADEASEALWQEKCRLAGYGIQDYTELFI